MNPHVTPQGNHEAPDISQGLSTLFNSLDTYVFIKDPQGCYVYVNQAVCELFRRPLADILGKDDSHFFNTDFADIQSNDRKVLGSQIEVQDEEKAQLLHEDKPRYFWAIKIPLRDGQGKVNGVIGISTEITDRVRHTRESIDRNALLQTVLTHVDAYIFMKDHDGKYLYANRKVEELYGLPLQDIVGRTDFEVLPEEVAQRLVAVDQQVKASGERIAQEEVVFAPDGGKHHFWAVKMPISLPGNEQALIGFASDITELRRLKADVEQSRTTDPVTGLGNRSHFGDTLALCIAHAGEQRTRLAVVSLDLDHFKYLNNTLGREAGDQALFEVGQRLQRLAPTGSYIARVASNQFALILTNVQSAAAVASKVDRIREALTAPMDVGPRPCLLTASLGISLYPDDGRGASALIAAAESAMYHAKEKGRNQQQFFSAELKTQVSERLELEQDLHNALGKQEFELYFQPQVDAQTLRPVGVEALIRWHRPGHGLVSPAVFIELAEQTGEILNIGAWVTEQACRQISAWSAIGLGHISVAVNLCPSQLMRPDFTDEIAAMKARYHIQPGQLHMEITESMMIEDPEFAIGQLQALKDSGIDLAMDDFGSGYSSMSYLKRLPVDILKLDRSFVSPLAESEIDRDISDGIIALARKLGLKTVAEGVETEAQAGILRAMNCSILQGYLYGRPMPAADITDYLLANAAH
ncbi:sensor domain-containing protein [Thalassolituus sp. LLYu03]|uniref:sensor domain-containing protein n=1 Tax=Thalassolituus sp. LLYu03 TaxID=3421656 RepID=UPI003D299825